MSRKPAAYPMFLKKFRGTEEEQAEFLKMLPGDARDDYLQIVRALKIYDILNEIEQAYPEDIFPPTTQAERDPVIEQFPGFIDRTSASMGRHLVKVIREKMSDAS